MEERALPFGEGISGSIDELLLLLLLLLLLDGPIIAAWCSAVRAP